MPARALLFAIALATSAASTEAQTEALQHARDSMLNSATDGGLARALAYCVFHAPAFDTILGDAVADGMGIEELGGGAFRILSPVEFPGALIQATPLNVGTASCLAWSGTARATDVDQAINDAVGFYLRGGRPEKLSASPSDYVYRDLPFSARLRGFAFQQGHGATFEVSGLAPQDVALLQPVPPEPEATTWPRTLDAAAADGKIYEFEFLFGTGCVVWLPDLRSAMTAMDRSSLTMAKNGETYFYVSDFGGLLQLTEGVPEKITECAVMSVIPLATANEIVRRTLAVGNLTFAETSHGDGTAEWTGTLASRTPGDEPSPFAARTYFEPRQAEVTIRLQLGGGPEQ